MNASSPRVIYLRLPNAHRTPVGAVAFTHNDGIVRVGFALQNPADKWDRSKAREIALARLNRRRDLVGAADRETSPHAIRYFEFECAKEQEGPYDYLARMAEAINAPAQSLRDLPAFQKLLRRIREMSVEANQRAVLGAFVAAHP